MCRQVHLFSPETIRRVVSPDKCGVYALGDMEDGEFQVKYVGRSDSCLRTRLLTHNHMYEFTYFYFLYMDSPAAAYRFESRWWHACVDFGVPVINKIHPDSPSNAFLTCPYCRFAQNVIDSIEANWPVAC